MAQENVEMVRQVVDASARRDLAARIATVVAYFSSPLSLAETIDGNSFQRREGMEAYFVDVDSAWEELRLIYDEDGYRDLGDRVLALGRIEGRGRGSGAVVVTPHGAVADFRDGKLSSVRSY